jgi:hypothetical protein
MTYKIIVREPCINMKNLNFADSVPEDVREQIRNTFARWEAGDSPSNAPFFNRNYRDEYLRSPEWKAIQRRILKRDNRMCWRCEGKATEVHHRSYADDVMAGNNDNQLASLCEGCHFVVGFDELNKKRTLEAADLILLTKCHDTEIPAPKLDIAQA